MFDVPDPDYIRKAETYGTDYMYDWVGFHAEEDEPEEEPVNEDDEYYYDN